MLILGIESSCDETGLALYDTANGLLAHALHSQVAMHEKYGGVVPELASRDHIRRVIPLLRQVLARTGKSLADVSGIAYTRGPGLAGALLVGAGLARALAYTLEIPAVGVHHLEGHLLSPLLADPRPEFPFVALLVSGGHTQLMQVEEVGAYITLGDTLDDAAGEAFDKTAQLLGLGYPGGPAVSRRAEQGNPARFKLPRPMLNSGDLNFSFSGLKTAVLTLRNKHPEPAERADIAAAFQASMVDVLVGKSLRALEQTGGRRLVVAGGVGANCQLRARLLEEMAKLGGQVYFPPLDLCTDNGAMIAYAGAQRMLHGVVGPTSFGVKPRWDLSEVR
ncbi:MAG TPA: tRNA (adenosine(37)-N6)-threonylcarbamoyltransferase complex transferase subunit TsaD [Thiobacillaceae bacterium]|nr:tRNA (adenosine(37)-N6)-threonylcarbamoyltransferase complex transferase subunit TsaD [Thiobacillaceae bacterium]